MTDDTNDRAEQSATDTAPAAAPKAPLLAGARVQPIVPRTVDEVARVARAVIVAGLAPNSYEGRTADETASRVMVGIMKGAEVGLAPITALSTIAIINGRPSIYGDGAVALCQASGKVESVDAHYEGQETPDGFPDNFTAVYSILRRGQDKPYVGRFSVADAKRAKLWQNPRKAPWMEHPKRMLMMRARAFALRDGFADCLSGLAIAEEAQDMPAPAPAPVNADFLNDPPAVAGQETTSLALAGPASPCQAGSSPAQAGAASNAAHGASQSERKE